MISQKILSQEKFYELCKRERICSLSYFDFIKMTRDSTTENIEFYIWQSGNWRKLLSSNEKLLSIARENCHFYDGFDYSLIMPKSYLKEILFSFSKAVNKNIFKSLPYNDYRALKKLAAQNDDIIVLKTNFFNTAIFQTGDETINISLPESSATKKTFKDFLKEEFYPNPVNEQKMPDITSLNVSGNTHNYCYTTTTEPTLASLSGYTITGTYPITTADNTITINTTNKENKKMKGFNFDFGPVKDNSIRMSMYGLAIKNLDGTWVSYNTATNDIIDVDVFNFDGSKFLYKIPVAITEIAVGDIVMHMGKPMFVVDISEAGEIMAIDAAAGEKKIIMLARSCFGFNYATKVVSLFNMSNSMPTPDAPFGNMLPFLMMDGEDTDMSDLMLLMMLNPSNGASNPMAANSMMMYLLAKGDNKDMLPLMLLMNNNNK